jgi:hypothetical protein
MNGYKRIIALALALVAVAARRLDLEPETLALLLDLTEAVLALGIGTHAAGAAIKRKVARKVAGVGIVLLASSCAVVDLEECRLQVSKSDAARDRLVCKGHDPIKVPRIDPVLRACVLAPPAPPVTP